MMDIVTKEDFGYDQTYLYDDGASIHGYERGSERSSITSEIQ
jgi:hypothetical protein